MTKYTMHIIQEVSSKIALPKGLTSHSSHHYYDVIYRLVIDDMLTVNTFENKEDFEEFLGERGHDIKIEEIVFLGHY